MAGPELTFEHFQVEIDSQGEPVVLGTSDHGHTFRAFDTRLRKTVALKVVDRALVSDANIRKRFLNEARAAAGISHPNIARVIHLCPPDAADCYYAMELVDGESLAQRIASQGRLSVPAALRTLRPIADVLVILGHQRLVHRDIQPANIILTPDAHGVETVKLINFGLAKSVGTHPGLLEVVHTAELRDTEVHHLSPEQIRGETVDARADFYSLGITLWTTIVGRPPFVGSPYDIHEGHLHGEVKWADLPPTTSPVRRLLEALLAKALADRPADATALCALWDDALLSHESAPAKSRGIDESDTSTRTIIDPPTAEKAPHLIPINVPPAGCSTPPESGFLAENTSDGEIVFVRPIPLGEPRLRRELLAVANISLSRPSPSLLNVLEIDDHQIVSEWRRGVSVADLLASRPGALPRRLTGPWLRTVAEAVDWAREQGIERANFSLGNWFVEFLDLKTGETPAEHATREPDAWGRTTVSIDPLAGFDPIILLASADPEQTLPAGRFAALTTPASYLTAFARHAERLLEPSRTEPLDGPARTLLTDAVAGQSKFATAREWAAALLGDEIPVVKAPPLPAAPAPSPAESTVAPGEPPTSAGLALPKIKVNAPNAAAAILTPPVPAPAAAPIPTPAAPKATPVGNRLPVVSKSSTSRRGLLLAAGGVVAALIVCATVLALRSSKEPAHPPMADSSAEVRRLIDLARGHLEQAQYTAASSQLAQARTAAGDCVSRANLIAEIDALSARLKAAEPPASIASVTTPTPAPPASIATATPPPTPPATTPAPADPIAAASREHPFENQLGLRFVPVPIVGGETGGRRVLFAVTETRVREFEKFAGRRWRDADASDDLPAVAVQPADIANFCRWLAQQAPLPPGWRYRLPTDHEWSCAAGLGREEDPTATGAMKGSRPRQRFAWGTDWPPPAGVGNFADEALGRTARVAIIRGYDDRFPGLAPVEKFRANALGLHDLAGNAAEWCYDASGYYLRGGAFHSATRTDLDLSTRGGLQALQQRDGTAGFRVVISDRQPPGPAAAPARTADAAGPRPNSTGTLAPSVLRFGAGAPAYSSGQRKPMPASTDGAAPTAPPPLAR